MFQKFSRESVGGVFRQWQIPNENGEACNKAYRAGWGAGSYIVQT